MTMTLRDAFQVLKFAFIDASNSLRVTVTNPGGASGLASPTVANVDLTEANTEYFYTITTPRKNVLLQSRKGAKIQFCFTLLESSLNYITIPPGCSFTIDNLELTDPLIIFLQSDQDNDVVEILTWD